MAGRGRPPAKGAPRNRTARQRGEWKATPGIGWQHEAIPDPPAGLLARSVRQWDVWFRSWYAANWGPENLPQLELTIQYWDEVQRSLADPFLEADGIKGGTVYYRKPRPMTELRQHMDSLGITPKGQQDRRWEKPAEATQEPASGTTGADVDPREAFGHLRAVK